MKKPAISDTVVCFDPEPGILRHPAVLFRRRVYVCSRHYGAIKLAFKGMTPLQKHHVSNRIADGKETILFGSAFGDGSGWEHDARWQASRMQMYGFD